MGDKLEVTLRITLDRPGLERQLRRPVESDTAFFILGLVHAQLTSTFGEELCVVEMEAATGVSAALIRDMNSFARRHKRALDTLDQYGEVVVSDRDRDIVEVFQSLHDVIITPLGAGWRVSRRAAPDAGEPLAN
jgi:hypothetical protein